MEKEIIYTMSEGETLKFPVPEGMEDNNIDGLTTTVDVLNAVKDNIGKDNDKAVELIDQLLNSLLLKRNINTSAITAIAHNQAITAPDKPTLFQ